MKLGKRERVITGVIIFALVLSLGVGIFTSINASKSRNNTDNIVNLNEISDDVAIKEVETEPEVTIIYPTEAEPESEVVEEPVPEVEETVPVVQDVDGNAEVSPLSYYHFAEGQSIGWPVRGEVILKYSMDSTIFYKSLGVYKCNPSISIAAEPGTNVGVVADGIVASVFNSEETGTTVVVAVGDGYEMTYGLLNDVVVKPGDMVTTEQLLGTVAEPTSYYEKEGGNIYFKITKDGAPVDPMDFLEQN